MGVSKYTTGFNDGEIKLVTEKVHTRGNNDLSRFTGHEVFAFLI